MIYIHKHLIYVNTHVCNTCINTNIYNLRINIHVIYVNT